MAVGERGDRLELGLRRHAAGRVVRVAQQHRARMAGERRAERVEVEGAPGRERHLDRPAPRLGDRLDDPLVGRRGDRDAGARREEHPQQLGETDHHAREQGDPRAGRVPSEPPPREALEGGGERGRIGPLIAQVVALDGGVQGPLDGLCHRQVELAEVGRQDVRRDPAQRAPGGRRAGGSARRISDGRPSPAS